MALGRDLDVPEAAKPAPNPLRNRTGAPTRETTIPDDAKARKQYPIGTGFLDYFPDAVAAVSEVSFVGNVQHNGPESPLFWNREKSGDESDALLRHFVRRGTWDYDKLPDGSSIRIRHSAKMAWRAFALLQKEIEADRYGEQKTEGKRYEDAKNQQGVGSGLPFPGSIIEYDPRTRS